MWSRKVTLNDERYIKAKSFYIQGMPIPKAAKLGGLGKNTLSRLLDIDPSIEKRNSKHRITHNDERYIKAKELYLSGVPIKNASKEVGLDFNRFSVLLELDKDVAIRKPKNDKITLDDERYIKAKELYLSGCSLKDIEGEVEINRHTISRLLKTDNIVVKNPNKLSIKQDIFNEINTEEKAYWLGFLYADGYVCNTKVTINLKNSDKKHLEKLKEFLEYAGEVKTYNTSCDGKTYKMANLSFSDMNISENLKNKGCIEKKSLILKFPSYDIVPKSLMRHFIRGYFDGDGYLGVSKIKQGELIVPRIGFLGTKKFIEGILNETKWVEKTLTHHKQHNENIFSIEWNGGKYYDILEYLYKDSTIFLDRKFELYLKLIKYKKEVLDYLSTNPFTIGKKINMLDENYNIIKRFNSQREVFEFVNSTGREQLVNAIKNKTKYKGYFWEYQQ